MHSQIASEMHGTCSPDASEEHQHYEPLGSDHDVEQLKHVKNICAKFELLPFYG